jgi:hypothetical protein
MAGSLGDGWGYKLFIARNQRIRHQAMAGEDKADWEDFVRDLAAAI